MNLSQIIFFRLYITTKLQNPKFSPDVAVKVAVVNFIITDLALQEQILGVAVARERPDLEAEKTQLVVQSAENEKYKPFHFLCCVVFGFMTLHFQNN